eukprot:4491785-Prymnesium_polylepis.2
MLFIGWGCGDAGWVSGGEDASRGVTCRAHGYLRRGRATRDTADAEMLHVARARRWRGAILPDDLWQMLLSVACAER